MSCASQRWLELARRLLQASRGTYLPATTPLRFPLSRSFPPLPCFPLKEQHVGKTISSSHTDEPPTPSDFHNYLCRKISKAKRRVSLASLYLGAGTTEREQQLLDSISQVVKTNPSVQVRILMDANRALRPVSHQQKTTSSAQALHECLQQQQHGSTPPKSAAVYLFQTLSELQNTWLPSPLNEAAGVFHMKVYIVDDELILSGGNLSEEYFFDRQDRYTWFRQGGGGLVDFYDDLVRVLCDDYAEVYPPTRDQPHQENKRKLFQSLQQLFDGSKQLEALDELKLDYNDNEENQISTKKDDNDIVACAIPTIQVPAGFFGAKENLPCLSDAQITRNLLLAAAAATNEHSHSCSLHLSSAYLNPTDNMLDTLRHFQNRVALLTAGPTSHGFAPKPGRPRRGDYIVPSVFATLNCETTKQLPQAQLLFYERPGWTFHSKGLWLTARVEKENSDEFLAGAMIGSGNFGARSELMDVESNCILIFPKRDSTLQRNLLKEWESMLEHAQSEVETRVALSSWQIRTVLPFIRDLF